MAIGDRKRAFPRGYRNNNPGNIERGSSRWQGLDPVQSDPRFATFSDPVWGIRAIARTLITYQDSREAGDGSRIDTIRETIERWAPAIENNVSAYVRHVDRVHPKGADEPLDFHNYDDLMPLVRGIIDHECGDPRDFGLKEWYPQRVIDEGLHRAGVVPKGPTAVRKAARDPEAVSTGVTAAGAIGGVGGSAYIAMELRDANAALRRHGEETGEPFYVVVPFCITILAALAALYFWRKRRKLETS